MFLDRIKENGKIKYRDKVMVGYDLCDDHVQITCFNNAMEEPETISTVEGAQIYRIPFVLLKRPGVNQWYYGKEALAMQQKYGVSPITGLLKAALLGEQIEVEETFYEAEALLTLFIKKSLSLISEKNLSDVIGTMMFSLAYLDDKTVEILGDVIDNLDLPKVSVYLQSHVESIYYYMMYQEKELWHQNVILCDYDGKTLKRYTFMRNEKTTPVVVLINEQEYDHMYLPSDWEERKDPVFCRKLDACFLELLQECIKEDAVSTVYLLGDGFSKDWMDQSIRYLCSNSRVFMGNNLFSKGACYALRDRARPNENSKKHVYLGKDKLKSNIGLQALKKGEPVYVTLLDAGNNWYEIQNSVQFFLPDDGLIPLLITPVDGQNKRVENLSVDLFEDRETGCSRAELTISMCSVSQVKIQINDLGFGEIYPASGKSWEFVLNL